MIGGTFRIARIAGISIGVHYTWLLAFFLITWSLASVYFPFQYWGWDTPLYWLLGVVSALCLFGSVLIHELAHSFVALWRGLPVQGITLFIFGGFSSIQMDREEAKDEFLVSIVGPVASLVLAGLFMLLGLALQPRSPLGAVVGYLAFINVLLAVFNLLPGFPLDGGRVLRAVLWGTTGSLSMATNIAAGIGQGFGFLLIALGVVQLFSGNVLGGFWIALIGWFLNSAAHASRREVTARESLRDVRVGDLMDRMPGTVTQDTLVTDLVHEYILSRGWRALPVCENQRLLGVVSLTDVKGLNEASWSSTRVAEIMTQEPLYSVRPSTEVTEALRILGEAQIRQVLVMEGENLVGLLTRAHIVDYLQFRQELGLRDSFRSRRDSQAE